MISLTFSPAAAADLEAITDYIAQDSPANALRFIDDLRIQCKHMMKAPLANVARAELGVGIQSCAHGRYVIFFRVELNMVRIERILHSARDLPQQLGGLAES